MAVSYISPLFSAADSLGAPLVSGKLYTYLAGTTTPATTYSDSAGASANANPIILNARGEAVVFLTAGTNYKFVLKTALDVTIWTQDDIAGPLSSATLAGSGGSSNVGYLPSGTGAAASTVQAKLRQFLTPLDYGCIGDGVTDDTGNFNEFLDEMVATGKQGDGLGLTYLLKNSKTITPTTDFKLRNLKVISGSTYSNQYALTLAGNVNYLFENISCDGQRNTRSGAGDEPWHVFTTFGGYSSISPLSASFISTTGAATAFTGTFTFRNLRVTNLHAAEPINIATVGAVIIDGLTSSNLSYRNYTILHDQATGGVTLVDKVHSVDTGILPANFLVDGVAKVRADPYAPQGAFAGLVTYGKYLVGNYYVKNYGSCGITADRNTVFEAQNILIEHTDANGFSNNPSGALWLENVTYANIDSAYINVQSRDARDYALDSSATQIFATGGSVVHFGKLTIVGNTSTANLRRGIRSSATNDPRITVDVLSISGLYVANAANYAVSENSVIGQDVTINSGEIASGAVNIDSPKTVVIRDLKMAAAITTAPSGNPGITGTVGDVGIFNSSITTYTNTITVTGAFRFEDNTTTGTVNMGGCSGKMVIARNNIGNSITMTGNTALDVVIEDNMSVAGTTLIPIGHNAIIKGNHTKQRIEVQDVQTFTIVGNTAKTDQTESIIWVNPGTVGNVLAGVIADNNVLIKTGTAGASYVTIKAGVTGVTDVDNNKLTVAWT